MSLRDKDYKLAVKLGIIDENTKDKLLKLFNLVLALYTGK